MPTLIANPTRIPVPGGKLLDEYIGRVNSKDSGVSTAHMRSPSGWTEPGQQPDFDEYTVVLRGSLRVESHQGVLEVQAGQAVVAKRAEWVGYSTPSPDCAESIAVYIHAFEL